MKRFFTVCYLFLICIELLNSQVQSFLCLNEGAYDYSAQKSVVPVSLGRYDFNTHNYESLFEIRDARFASDLKVLDGEVWVAADRFLNKYRLSDFSLEASLEIEGIRKFGFYEDLIIVSRGEYAKKLDSYIQIYDKKTLRLLYEVPFGELPYTTESVLIKGHYAYVGVNNGFEFGKEVGKIVKFNLKQLRIEDIIELGDQGKNPENLMLYKEKLVSFNNKDYMGSSVSLVDLQSGSMIHHALSDVQSLCGTSVLMGDRVLYQEYGETELGNYDFNSGTSGFYLDPKERFYGMQVFEREGIILAGLTDFAHYGKVHIYDLNWNLLNQFEASIAPAYFAVVSQPSSSEERKENSFLKIFPNPARLQLRISSDFPIEHYAIKDVNGLEILKGTGDIIPLESLATGVYIICAQSGSKVVSSRFLKTR